MRRLVAIFAGLLVAFGVIACERTPRIAPLAADAVILAFGDSLTHGNGAPDGQAYPDILAGLLGRTVINAGVPGEISAAGRQRLPQLLAEHQPQLVILCHGGNDFLRRLDRAHTAANLAAMVAAIRASGADVVLIGVPEPGLFLEPPEFYRKLAGEAGLPYEGEIIAELLGDRRFKSDTVHPNAAGYRRLAEALHALIRSAHGL